MERVIFRREYDPYMKEWGFLAAFPDDDCNRGMISGISFKFGADGKPVFEPYTDYALNYYYGKRLVKRNTPDADRCRKAIEGFYNTKFRVCEKI